LPGPLKWYRTGSIVSRLNRDQNAGRRLEVCELIEIAMQRMTEDEQQILDLRGSGLDWVKVADRVGGTPEGLRKKLARGVERNTWELGPEEVDDE
jgi:hypothetical protein